jgi:hypothetical protein
MIRLPDWYTLTNTAPVMPTPAPVEKISPSTAIGSTGLKRWGDRGLVHEEFMRDLSGSRGYRKYREMRDNDPIVGAVMYAIETVIRNVTWRVEGGADDAHELLESCMHDMGASWSNTMAEILSMLPFGWSLFEVTYKRRNGDNRNPLLRSKFTDGKIGWKKWSIRGQDTLTEWVWDEDGEVIAFVQNAPPRTLNALIPMDRCLLFRTGTHKDNPEGRSILRNAYQPWYYAQHLQRIEAIGHERDMAGLPVIKASERAIARYEAVLQKIVTSIKNDENAGIILPQVIDPATGKGEIELELLSAAGAKQFDIDKSITRYQKLIAITVMADFVMLGHEKVGSLALADSKTSMFALAVGSILESIASEINDREVPRLLRYNGMPTTDAPRLVPGDIEKIDPQKIAAFITAMASAGVLTLPDEELENHLREIMDLPERPEIDMARPPGMAQPPAVNPRTPTEPDVEDEPEEETTDPEEVE